MYVSLNSSVDLFYRPSREGSGLSGQAAQSSVWALSCHVSLNQLGRVYLIETFCEETEINAGNTTTIGKCLQIKLESSRAS